MHYLHFFINLAGAVEVIGAFLLTYWFLLIWPEHTDKSVLLLIGFLAVIDIGYRFFSARRRDNGLDGPEENDDKGVQTDLQEAIQPEVTSRADIWNSLTRYREAHWLMSRHGGSLLLVPAWLFALLLAVVLWLAVSNNA
jgi:hypothetical protein